MHRVTACLQGAAAGGHHRAPGRTGGDPGAAVLLFLATLSFLFTTPGVTVASAGGFPVLSVLPGQFLVKDLVLIGASVWTLGDCLGTARSKASPAG